MYLKKYCIFSDAQSTFFWWKSTIIIVRQAKMKKIKRASKLEIKKNKIRNTKSPVGKSGNYNNQSTRWLLQRNEREREREPVSEWKWKERQKRSFNGIWFIIYCSLDRICWERHKFEYNFLFLHRPYKFADFLFIQGWDAY